MSYVKSIFTSNVKIDGGSILYNFSTGKMIELDEGETALWNADVNSFNQETIDYLYRERFLYDDSVDQFETYNKIVESKNKEVGNNYYKIFTTTCCNARCYYCFEKGYKQETLDFETSERIIDYITENSADKKRIDIGWFGGEPLMNPDVITYISQGLKKKNGTKIMRSSMITNGSLFDDRLIDLAVRCWNLEKVQITLDGTEYRHNQIKNYTDSRYNYAQTLDNIERLVSKQIKVTVRLNYSQSNYADIITLIDDLKKRFGRKIRVYASPVLDMVNGPTNEVMDYETYVFDKMVESGYLDPKILLRIKKRSCGLAACERHAVISPSGKVYKCAEAINRDDIALVDDVNEPNFNHSVATIWKDGNLALECHTCRYYPICLGGCRATQLGVNCAVCFRFKNQIERALLLIYEKSIKSCEKSSGHIDVDDDSIF